MLILAIESSCDETACAVVENGVKEIASQVASSAELHYKTGGVVPEVAARKQVDYLIPVLEATIEKAAAYLTVAPEQVKTLIDAVAVTVGPGLIGSLIVGIEAAKAVALAWNKPLIPVNHLVGHIYANFLETLPPPNEALSKNKKGKALDIFPAIVLIVSGGHTDLVLMKDHGRLDYLGGTIDDAAGEAFDKVARILKLGTYLGGAILSKTANDYIGQVLPQKLPRSFIHADNFDFSFSGLKTAVKRLVDKNSYPVAAVAKEFEEAVVEVLVEKTLKAVETYKTNSILLGGGVSANQRLRKEMADNANSRFGKVWVHTPPLRLCTDNAVCIASAAFFNQKYRKFSEVTPNPSLTIKDL